MGLVGRNEHRVPSYAPLLRKVKDPTERERQEADFLKQERMRAKGAMSPATMASLLLKAVEDGQFYVLGYDDQQPLDWLKLFVQLRCEDIVQGRPPSSHLLADSESRRR